MLQSWKNYKFSEIVTKKTKCKKIKQNNEEK
jgi:hypothetical protein